MIIGQTVICYQWYAPYNQHAFITYWRRRISLLTIVTKAIRRRWIIKHYTVRIRLLMLRIHNTGSFRISPPSYLMLSIDARC